MSYQRRLLQIIPGGAHTYSRGWDQFPSNAPEILVSGRGAYVTDDAGRTFLDYGMGLRSVILGYADPDVNAAVVRAIERGNNLTRTSTLELEAAERFLRTIDGADMVKFCKNGSNAVTAAVKLARAFTGRDLIARCAEHPFFSFDDWFIGNTPMARGIPEAERTRTLAFHYNDLASLESLVERNRGRIACVVLEPAQAACPMVDGAGGCCSHTPCTRAGQRNFLHDVQDLCRSHGIVFILDEMITGFRWHLKGAQHLYGVTPDLSTFGKAMANGFALAALAGRREIMELGSTEFPGRERVFLLSTTHGGEMTGYAAFLATMDVMERRDVVGHVWSYGRALTTGINAAAEAAGLAAHVHMEGPNCSPVYVVRNKAGEPDMALRTLFSQELVRHGVLMPWVALSAAHGSDELEKTLHAVRQALTVVARAMDEGVQRYLEGHVLQPVFRRYN